MRAKKKSKGDDDEAEKTLGEKINPYIVQCLQALEKEAKRKNQDKLRITYSKALKSVQKYPLLIRNGKDAMQLEGIGPKLASLIDNYLQKNADAQEFIRNAAGDEEEEDAEPSSATTSKQTSDGEAEEEEEASSTSAGKKKKSSASGSGSSGTTRKYVPKYKSASWAILVCMYREHKKREKQGCSLEEQKITKEEIIEKSTSLTDTPMLPTSAAASKYCGWNSMKSTLLKKDLVQQFRSRPYKYVLTETGRRLARMLHQSHKRIPDQELSRSDNELEATEDDEEEEAPKKAKAKKTSTKPKKRKSKEDEEEDEAEKPVVEEEEEVLAEESPKKKKRKEKAASSSSVLLATKSAVEMEIEEEVLPEAGRDEEDDVSIHVASSQSQTLFEDDDDDLHLHVISSSDDDKEEEEEEDEEQDIPSKSSHPSAPSSSASSDDTPIVMHYLNFLNEKANRKDEAKVKVNIGLGGLCFLVHASVPVSQFSRMLVDQISVESKKQNGNTWKIEAWVPDELAPDDSKDLVSNFFVAALKPPPPPKKPVIVPLNPKQQTKKAPPAAVAEPPAKKQTTKTAPSAEKPKAAKKKQETATTEKPTPTAAAASQSKPAPAASSQSAEKLPPKPARTIVANASSSSSNKRIDYKDFFTKSKNSTATTTPAPATTSKKLTGYEVLLIIDSRERYKGNDRKYLYKELTSRGINCKLKSLSLGDMLWVIRKKPSTASSSKNRGGGDDDDEEEEAGDVERVLKECRVLNYIVERKAVDDLASSIIDGRYKEQKYRLKQSGIGNIFYIVEGDVKHQTRLPQQHLETAMVNIQIQDGFYLKRTQQMESTIQFLMSLTKKIETQTAQQLLLQPHQSPLLFEKLQTFEHFNQQMLKHRNLMFWQVFGRQLCVVHGCSANVAESILQHYKTPKHLYDAFVNSSDALSNVLISNHILDVPTRRIGNSLNTFLYKLYNSSTY